MSFIEVMLSHKEVLISLLAVVLILFIAIGIAVAPKVSRSWKRAVARRKVNQAQRKAKQAERKAAELKKTRAAQTKPAPRKRAVVVANQQAATAVPADASAVAAVNADAPPIAADNVEVTPAAAPSAEPEAQPAEAEESTDIQSILNAVFVDEESNSRYEVLLQDVEAITGAELLEMATRVSAALRAAQHKAG